MSKAAELAEFGGGISGGTDAVSGVAKAWADTLADGTGINDSFNIASIADDGTGLQTMSFTNSMANSNYIALATSINSYATGITDSHATSTYRGVSRNSSTTALVDTGIQSGALGDLA